MHMHMHACTHTAKVECCLSPLANTALSEPRRTLQADAMLQLSLSRLSAMLFISQLLACLGCADMQVRRQSSSMK